MLKFQNCFTFLHRRFIRRSSAHGNIILSRIGITSLAYTIPPPIYHFLLKGSGTGNGAVVLLCGIICFAAVHFPMQLFAPFYWCGVPFSWVRRRFAFDVCALDYARLVVCRRSGFRCHFQAAPVRCFLRQSGTISVAAYHLRLYAVACGDMQKPPR